MGKNNERGSKPQAVCQRNIGKAPESITFAAGSFIVVVVTAHCSCKIYDLPELRVPPRQTSVDFRPNLPFSP